MKFYSGDIEIRSLLEPEMVGVMTLLLLLVVGGTLVGCWSMQFGTPMLMLIPWRNNLVSYGISNATYRKEYLNWDSKLQWLCSDLYMWRSISWSRLTLLSRDNCLKGCTFLLEHTHKYNIWDRLQSMVDSIDGLSSSSQGLGKESILVGMTDQSYLAGVEKLMTELSFLLMSQL